MLVVICYLDVFRAFVRPHKANAVLLVNSNAVLALAVPSQLFELIRRRRLQIAQRSSRSDVRELPLRNAPNRVRAGFPRSLRILVVEHILSTFVLEAYYHFDSSSEPARTLRAKLLYRIAVYRATGKSPLAQPWCARDLAPLVKVHADYRADRADSTALSAENAGS